jgi:sugar lactone lactonase YvrE
VRVGEGGTILSTVRVPDDHIPTCCVLAGPDRRTLCITSTSVLGKDAVLAARTGRISTLRVDVAGTGRP